VSDARRRELERAQDPAAAAEALGAALRAGEFEAAEVSLLAYLELPGARELQAQLDPARVPRKTWPLELEELELLSSPPGPGRFCLAAWPLHLALAVRSCVALAARWSESRAIRRDPNFPNAVSASLVDEVIQEAVVEGAPWAADLAEALVILRDAPGWSARGGEAPLELQVFPPLCRILGRERVAERVRADLLRIVLGEEE
jgi:hypothetical protein